MSKLYEIFFNSKHLIIGVLFFTLISLGVLKLYEEYSRYHIFVKFVNSGPLFKGMPVCFRGYRIGKTQEVALSEDYKYTLVKIVLFPENPKLPKDVEGMVKKHDFLGNYIDLIAPDEPSPELLKNGDIIEGTPSFEMGNLLAEVAKSNLIQNFSNTTLSINSAGTEIGGFFSDSRSVLKDNRQNLKSTTSSLNKITTNFDTSLDPNKLNNTTSSVEKSANNIQIVTENIKNITQSVDCATRNLDKTVAKIDATVAEANAVASNAKTITGGVRDVMGKRFAGLRIIFGKPLNKQNSCQK